MPVKHIVLMKFKADTPDDALQKASDNLLALKGEFIIACAHPQRCFVCVRAVRAIREYAEHVVPISGGERGVTSVE